MMQLMSGEADHALRISVWVTNKSWVWPARNAASDYTNGAYPPMGSRIRLKSSFDTSGYPPQSKAILEVLKKHGAMVADNGALFRVYLQEDSRWTDSDLDQLNNVLTKNFEVVDVSSLMINIDSGQARVTSTATSGPSITVASPNGGESLGSGYNPCDRLDFFGEYRVICEDRVAEVGCCGPDHNAQYP